MAAGAAAATAAMGECTTEWPAAAAAEAAEAAAAPSQLSRRAVALCLLVTVRLIAPGAVGVRVACIDLIWI